MFQKKCLVCGELYTQCQKTQKYCSKKCREFVENERQKKERLEKRKKIDLKRNCLLCKKIFCPDYKHKYTKFCSQKCRSKYYKIHNKERIKIYKKEYAKKDKYQDWKKRYDKQYKDKLRFGGFRKEVMKRDNYSCQICGREYPYVNLVVHHIDRDTKNNTLENLQVLCRVCHARVHSQALS